MIGSLSHGSSCLVDVDCQGYVGQLGGIGSAVTWNQVARRFPWRDPRIAFDGGGPSDVEKGQFSVASQRQVTGTFRAIYYLVWSYSWKPWGCLYTDNRFIASRDGHFRVGELAGQMLPDGSWPHHQLRCSTEHGPTLDGYGPCTGDCMDAWEGIEMMSAHARPDQTR